MAGPKDSRTPEQYKEWLRKHRIAERKRLRTQKYGKEKVHILPWEERGSFPQTYSLTEAYYHPSGCICGSCVGRPYIKVIREQEGDKPVTTRGRRLPELPHRILLRLQAAEAEAQLKAVEPSTQPEEQD